MKQQYDEIMEHIRVTEEMRSRILTNLQQAEVKPVPRKTAKKVYVWRGALAAAACLALMLAGSRGLLWRAGSSAADMTAKQNEVYSAEGVMESAGAAAVNGMRECESAEELAAAVGFSIPELQALPFTVQQVRYTDYWETIAQAVYEGENGEQAVMRKGRGEDPVSGDYTVYAVRRTAEAGSVDAELKGEAEGQYTLAEWVHSGYAYSLSLSEPQNEAWWQSAIEEILEQEEK